MYFCMCFFEKRIDIIFSKTEIFIQAANVVVGLFTVMIFFVIHIICGTENDVVVNVTFINMSGNDIRKFPL